MNLRADNQLNKLLQTLQNPAVRDLAWSCFSPPLLLSEQLALPGQPLRNCALQLDSTRQDWLERLDAQPAALLAHLEGMRSHRLGLYFENLWHFFLQQDERVELTAHNLAVRQGKQTIGEFDCLYYCHERQRHIHLELAVKFYLGWPGVSGSNAGQDSWRRFLGPGGKDRLDLKLERMRQHQLQLGLHEAAREPLRRLGIVEMELEMEMKGRLFQPVTPGLAPPLGYNPALAMSRWMTGSQALASIGSNRVSALARDQWLAPLKRVSEGAVQTMEELYRHSMHNLDRPKMLATLNSSGEEQQRIFITPERWPEPLS